MRGEMTAEQMAEWIETHPPLPGHVFMDPCGQDEGSDRCWYCGHPKAAHPAVLDTRLSRADTAPGGGLREALDDANRIISMTRDHLRRDHPDCAYEALGVLNDASRAALAAPSRDAGLDVERLARALTIVALTANFNGLLPKFQFAAGPGTLADGIAAEYARLTADGPPFPAGVTRPGYIRRRETAAAALLDAVEEAVQSEALPGTIHNRLKAAYNAVVEEANR